MRKARFWGLLCMLFVSEVQPASDPDEERYEYTEGQSLTLGCPFNIMKYASSRKAWQRLQAGREPLTLVSTDRPTGNPSEVRVGRYMLTDVPREAMLHVQMTNLRVEDSGLYRCVIYHPPKDPVLLFHPVRLVVTRDPSATLAASDVPTPNAANISTSAATKNLSSAGSTTPTQHLPRSPTVVSSPDPGVTFTNVTSVVRVSVFIFIVPVVCGFLSKALVFIVLFAVTKKSFG
uniref:Triggering receptor expressed on myeloid cells 1 n=1 Tax=Jaculus jaculus TaxID=51337 RepID=A0A8C5K1Y6_JACJA